MTFDHLANLFLSWGWKVNDDEYANFSAYVKFMLERNRVIIVYDGDLIVAVILYFITNDFSKVYKKGVWDTFDDEPLGTQIYLDKMLCRKWTPSLRRYLKSMIELEFPLVEEGYYHRAPYDRCVRILTRRGHEIQSTVSRR